MVKNLQEKSSVSPKGRKQNIFFKPFAKPQIFSETPPSVATVLL
jgi:hypothetical protein